MKMDFSNVLSDPLTLALLVVMAAGLVVLVTYYALMYFRVGRHKCMKADTGNGKILPPVSVVLVSQNDGEWLRNNLMYLLEQDYPDFEVVVVDYLSTDDTQFVLQILTPNYNRLKVVTIREDVNGFQGKKWPLSLGIKSAKNDLLLFADPDCMPQDLSSFCWIREMVAGYIHKHIDVVLGYCAVQHRPGLLNLLQQYDNLDYSAEYLGAAMLHHPYTGSGRNLSYRRSLFMKNNGFIYHYYEPEGTDDIFLNQNCKRRNTSVALARGAYVSVAPQPSCRAWRVMRKRRSVTHRYYRFATKLTRLARPLSVLLFYAAAVLLLVLGTFPWPVLAGAVAVKLAWQIVAMLQAARRLDAGTAAVWLSPLLEIYFLISNTFLRIMPLSNKNQ